MFSFRALVLAFTLQTVFCPNTFSETSLGNHAGKVQETSNPDGRPTTAENQVSRNVSGRLEIKDRNGNLIGILVGDEIKNADGKILGTVVRDAAGNITSTAWDINQLGTLPEGSPLRKQYDELKQDIFRLQRETKEQINQLDTKINAADSDARRVSEEMNKLLSSWTGATAAVLTNTVEGLQSTYEAHEREGNALKKQKADALETQAKVEKLMKEGKLSEAYAVLNGKGDEFRRAMGDITAQTMRDLRGANQQLSQAIESANRWESGLRTTRNIAVVGGAVIATGGLASVGFVAAAAGGTAAGTAIGAVSNFTEAHEQVNFGNMTSQEAYQRAWQQTGQDLLTSAQIGISGGTAGLAGRGVQGALGTVRAATTSGRLITGASAGAVSGFTGSALNTGTNMALGRETRSGGQIAVDTVTQTFVGGLSGGMGAGTQLRLDRLAAQQGGAVTATQQVTNRLVGDVVAPTALSAAGTYAANVATGRQGPSSEELITNAAVAGIGAYAAGRVSRPSQSESGKPNARAQLKNDIIEATPAKPEIHEKAGRKFDANERDLAEVWRAEDRNVYAMPDASNKGKTGKKSPDAMVEGGIAPSRSNAKGYGTVEFKTPEPNTDVSTATVRLIESSFNGSSQAPRVHVDGSKANMTFDEANRVLSRMVGKKGKDNIKFEQLEWIRITGKDYDVVHNYKTGQRWKINRSGDAYELIPPPPLPPQQ